VSVRRDVPILGWLPCLETTPGVLVVRIDGPLFFARDDAVYETIPGAVEAALASTSSSPVSRARTTASEREQTSSLR
jgi:MFS superfamily sulfate permease-like transporter